MEEVVFTLQNKTEILMVDTMEDAFQSFGIGLTITSPLLWLARLFSCGLILGTNVPMILFTMNQGSKTFLDWMIVFDCFLCLCNLKVIMFLTYISDDNVGLGFCICHVFSTFFCLLCNRLLTLGIAIYRFTLILGSSFVFSSNQKRVLEKRILLAILLISLNLTGWASYYREDFKPFLGKVKIWKRISVKILKLLF